MNHLLTHQAHTMQDPQSNTQMDDTTRRYQAFLLRIWREDEQTPWRIQIENPHTREIIGFQNIEKLVSFLNEQALRPGGCAG